MKGLSGIVGARLLGACATAMSQGTAMIQPFGREVYALEVSELDRHARVPRRCASWGAAPWGRVAWRRALLSSPGVLRQPALPRHSPTRPESTLQPTTRSSAGPRDPTLRSSPRASTGHSNRIHRSEAAKDDFMRQTAHPHGWPGHVVDHVVPLACGGADAPSNVQWQTVEEAKAKDPVERRGCRRP